MHVSSYVRMYICACIYHTVQLKDDLTPTHGQPVEAPVCSVGKYYDITVKR